MTKDKPLKVKHDWMLVHTYGGKTYAVCQNCGKTREVQCDG